jgi:hypothetical protein
MRNLLNTYFGVTIEAPVTLAIDEAAEVGDQKAKLIEYRKTLRENQEIAANRFAGLIFPDESTTKIPKVEFIKIMTKNHSLLTTTGFRKFVLEAR